MDARGNIPPEIQAIRSQRTLTPNSDCPVHGSHKVRYCPDYGYIPGKRYGAIPDQSPKPTLDANQKASLAKAIEADGGNPKVVDLL